MKKPAPATTAEQAAPPWVDVASSSLPGGALVKLVQLRAVVRWLMEAKSLHFLPAAVALYDALQRPEGLKLYLDLPNGSACSVGAGDTFQMVLPVVRGGVVRRVPALRPLLPGVTPGQSAALSYLKNVWCNGGNSESAMDWGLEWSNNDPSKAATYLAVSCEQAAVLWGEKPIKAVESGPLTYAAMVRQRLSSPKSDWTDPQIEALRQEEKDRNQQNHTGVRASMAKELGISVTRIGQSLSSNRVVKRSVLAKLKSA